MNHTIDDLWNEPIEHGMPWVAGYRIPPEFRTKYIPSGRLIRPVIDTANIERLRQAAQYDWGNKLNQGYHQYRRLVALYRPWYTPPLKTVFDRLRYRLHMTLIAWKVVI